jgi:hypothetical protein
VTTPVEALTVATEGFTAVHEPPVTGATAKVVVEPTHMAFDPVILTTGLFLIVTGFVGAELHPVAVSVNTKVAEPTAIPVTKPELLTVAINGLLDAHVPPVVGDNCVVKPAQISLDPVIDTVGPTLTVMVIVFVQPVLVSVNVITEVPFETPVTVKPLTVATPVVPLDHVPPVVGDKVVVAPIQMVGEAAMTVGLGLTVIFPVVLEQPVAVSVKTKDVVP